MSSMNSPKPDELKEYLEEVADLSSDEAEQESQKILMTNRKFFISSRALDTDAFFDVTTTKGLTLVLFNESHRFYSELISKLDEEEREIFSAAIAGFARVMNETTDSKRSQYLNTVRREWGKVVSDFLDDSIDREAF